MIRRVFIATFAAAATALAAWTVLPTLPGIAGEVANTKDYTPADGTKSIVVAGGCFWCVESDFDKVPGVVATVSGYAGGSTDNPTYKSVTYGDSGHYEVVRIDYDPAKVTLDRLLDVFWRSIDPLDATGQFCDKGASYKSAVFVDGAQERASAEKTKASAETELGKPFVTPILPAAMFYPAEEYHQDFHTKNKWHYQRYRWGCGRNARVQELWGDNAWGGIPHS